MADLDMFALFYGDRLTQPDMLSRTEKLVSLTPRKSYSPDFSGDPQAFLDYMHQSGMPTPVQFINQYLARAFKGYSASRVEQMRTELNAVLTSENGVRSFLRSLESDISGLMTSKRAQIAATKRRQEEQIEFSPEEIENMFGKSRDKILVGAVDLDTICPFNYEWHTMLM